MYLKKVSTQDYHRVALPSSSKFAHSKGNVQMRQAFLSQKAFKVLSHNLYFVTSSVNGETSYPERFLQQIGEQLGAHGLAAGAHGPPHGAAIGMGAGMGIGIGMGMGMAGAHGGAHGGGGTYSQTCCWLWTTAGGGAGIGGAGMAGA